MFKTKAIKVSDTLYALEQSMGSGLVRCFLILGSEKALLLDCGVIPDDLLGLVRTITDLPLMVALTHADGDHIVNAEQFPELYAHEDDAHMVVHRFASLEGHVLPLKDGECIDLGGTVLDITHIPGHTHGSLAYRNLKEGYLIAGDSVDYAPVYMFGNHRNFEHYVASLKRLQVMGGYHRIYTCHGELCIPANAVAQQLLVCDGIRDGSITPKDPDAPHVKDSGAKLYERGPCAIYYAKANT
ncbi:MAG: MBL fold metallo-hydrolase [Ruminococcaceae bacterium]|nr:MBL fold metallo-hydrolase [Oscillospiraceae bacterium]